MPQTSYHARVPFDFQGLQIRELTPTETEFASVAEISVPPGGTHKRARSRRCEKLYVCLSGQVRFQIEGHEHRLSEGDVVAIPRLHWFAYANETTADAKLLLVHVPPFDLDAEEFAEP